jgi:hypothetical protein
MKYLKLYEEFKFSTKIQPQEPEVEPEVEPDTMPLPPEEPDYYPEEPGEWEIERPELDPDPQASEKREEELMHKVYKKYKKLHEDD